MADFPAPADPAAAGERRTGGTSVSRPHFWMLALVALWLGLSLPGCQRPVGETSLVEEFPWVVSGPLLAPAEELGHARSAAFLAGRWQQSRETPERALVGSGSLVFYADEAVPVNLILEGRAGSPCTIRVSVNGDLPNEMQLTTQWSVLQLELPAAQVRPGRNTVGLQGGSLSEWRRFEVSPSLAGRAASPSEQLGAYVQNGPPATLNVPYANRLVFPLQLPGGPVELRIDRIEAWNDLGGALPLTEEWELSVELRSEDPVEQKSWLLRGTGTHRLVLSPSQQPRTVNLALTAHLKTRPLPGQLGLTLFEPRLSYPESPTGTADEAEDAGEGGSSSEPSVSPTSPFGPPAGKAAPKPNVLIYLVDTLRADHLGCYGYTKPTSPRLDSLAAEGILFEDVTAESPWTKPSTATVLTGLPSLAHGVLDFADQLPPDKTTLAELFAAAGYDTAGFFTNPMASPLFGFERGFAKVDYERLEDCGPMTDRVVDWLQQRSNQKPFFLYIHTLDPHLPYAPPAALAASWSPDKARFDDEDYAHLVSLSSRGRAAEVEQLVTQMTALYDGEIAANDMALGRLLDQLKSQGVYDQTLILVISDHGEELYDRQAVGHLHSLYQELIRVPWVMKLPGGAQAGRRVSSNWRHLDMAPTVLTLAGLAVPAQMTGRSFDPGSPESPSPPSLSYVHTGRGAVPMAQASHPYLLQAEGLRLGKYQLVRAEAQLMNRLEPLALYDLESDPGQHTNLAFERPVTRAHLLRLTRTLLGRIIPSTSTPTADPTAVQDSLRGLQYLR
jgi:arylsulfatase A-like enzyme